MLSKISQRNTNIIYCHLYVETKIKKKKANEYNETDPQREERRKGQNKIRELRGTNYYISNK